jgi:hypothetical protein
VSWSSTFLTDRVRFHVLLVILSHALPLKLMLSEIHCLLDFPMSNSRFVLMQPQKLRAQAFVGSAPANCPCTATLCHSYGCSQVMQLHCFSSIRLHVWPNCFSSRGPHSDRRHPPSGRVPPTATGLLEAPAVVLLLGPPTEL